MDRGKVGEGAEASVAGPRSVANRAKGDGEGARITFRSGQPVQKVYSNDSMRVANTLVRAQRHLRRFDVRTVPFPCLVVCL